MEPVAGEALKCLAQTLLKFRIVEVPFQEELHIFDVINSFADPIPLNEIKVDPLPTEGRRVPSTSTGRCIAIASVMVPGPGFVMIRSAIRIKSATLSVNPMAVREFEGLSGIFLNFAHELFIFAAANNEVGAQVHLSDLLSIFHRCFTPGSPHHD